MDELDQASSWDKATQYCCDSLGYALPSWLKNMSDRLISLKTK